MNRLRHTELSIASLAFSHIIRLFIFPSLLSERDTPHSLKGISLHCGRVREFLEYLEAHARLPGWQDDSCRATKGIDPIVGGVGWVDSRAAVVGSLPLTVADHPELQERVHLLLQRKNLHKRIVEVEGLAGMDIGSLLGRMKLVQLIGRNRGRFVLGQVKGFACCRGVRPVSRAGAVGRASSEPPAWREEAVSYLHVGAFEMPA